MPFRDSYLLPNAHPAFDESPPAGYLGGADAKGDSNETSPGKGCGTAATDRLIPDSVFGIDLGPACRAHDQCYDIGSTVPRAECDARLGADITAACIDGGGVPLFCAALGSVYETGVRLFGAAAYQGDPPPAPVVIPLLAQIPDFYQF